jgi:hypothetical protein
MSALKTQTPVTVTTAGTKQPVLTGAQATVSQIGVSGGVLTVVTSAAHGYAVGQQIGFFGVGTNTFLNGALVTITRIVSATSFEALHSHANVGIGGDTGTAFAQPAERFRMVRLEIDQSAAGAKIFVGDPNVSSTQYTACLSLSGQLMFEFSGEAIDASRIYVDTSASGTKAQLTTVQ